MISAAVPYFGEAGGPFDATMARGAAGAALPMCEQIGPKLWKLMDVASDAECASLIDAAERIGFEGAASYCHLYRTRYNDRLVANDEALAAALGKRCLSLLPRTVSSPAWGDGDGVWRVDALNPRFRLCKYVDGHYFGPHIDGNYNASRTRRSRLTFMMYLNPAAATPSASMQPGSGGAATPSALPTCSGGSTNFFKRTGRRDSKLDTSEVAHEIVPSPGLAVAFFQCDSDGDLLHEGARVTGGTKYILRTDIMCELEE